jgi:hypothetical protein
VRTRVARVGVTLHPHPYPLIGVGWGVGVTAYGGAER